MQADENVVEIKIIIFPLGKSILWSHYLWEQTHKAHVYFIEVRDIIFSYLTFLLISNNDLKKWNQTMKPS